MCSVDIAYLDQGLCGRADNNKYNIARDGSLCRTLRNIKTTSIYFYLFFYLPITGPESPYKTFSNENISSNPIKGLLHIFQTLYPVQFSDQIFFLNKFANFISWNKNCQRITDSSKYIINVIHGLYDPPELCSAAHLSARCVPRVPAGLVPAIVSPIISTMNDIYSEIWVTMQPVSNSH